MHVFVFYVFNNAYQVLVVELMKYYIDYLYQVIKKIMDKHNFSTSNDIVLDTEKNSNELFLVNLFHGIISDKLASEHISKQTCIKLVFFTKGSGECMIDFEHFSIHKGTVCFICPEQVYQWKFGQKCEGFIVNFSANLFEIAGIKSSLLNHFSFFKTMNLSDQILEIEKSKLPFVIEDLDCMFKNFQEKDKWTNLKISTDLLQLLMYIDRISSPTINLLNEYQSLLIYNFQELIDKFYKEIKLPKEYAELLYITPNHLNALCKDILGLSAGELIRNRIVLEAKRLLVNKDLSVNEIAHQLNFQDPSYFVKFFKKYTTFTPDQFRKNHYL